MEDNEKKSCTYEGYTRENGEQLCIADKCMMCNDGEWDYITVEPEKGRF